MAADLHRTQAAALHAGVAIGVAGAGTMGAGIAQVAAIAGHRVHLYDKRPGAAKLAVEGILAMLEKLVAKQKMTGEQAQLARENLHVADTLDAFADCGLVLEAIVEELEAKRSLFRDIEAIVRSQTILATNTSSISIIAIAADLRHPQRLAGMHFFNPAPLMPLVEIVSGAATLPAVADTLYATATAWGKTPVHARSTPGFIVNRVARPFYAEALRLLNERAADCATIDAVMRDCGGFRMGPFELMDLIGNDINYAVTRSVFDAFYGDPRFTPSLLQLELVEAGRLGRKTGRGFYDYAEDAPAAMPNTLQAQPAPAHVCLYGYDPLSAALAQKLSGTAIKVESLQPHVDDRIADSSACTLYRTDGRTATALAAANGIADTVLVDLALDDSHAKRLALAAADQADGTALLAAAGLLQAAGYTVSPMEDAPGMIVMRTVAMLANEAADAVHQGVCSAADADLAMRKGVNYPRGPLEWADAISVSTIVQVLDHMAEAYGETRYRVSPLLRRRQLGGGLSKTR